MRAGRQGHGWSAPYFEAQKLTLPAVLDVEAQDVQRPQASVRQAAAAGHVDRHWWPPQSRSCAAIGQSNRLRAPSPTLLRWSTTAAYDAKKPTSVYVTSRSAQ